MSKVIWIKIKKLRCDKHNVNMPSGEVKINIWGDPWEITKRKNCGMKSPTPVELKQFN